jgi:replicative DNA helicase
VLGVAGSVIRSALSVVEEALTVHGVLGDDCPPRIPCGFPCIDDQIGGLTAGELTVIGARPNVGKSTALLYMARTMEQSGHIPGVVSLEDSPITVGERIQSFCTGLSPVTVRKNGRKYRNDKKITRCLEDVGTWNTRFLFPIGGDEEETLDAMSELVSGGCDVLLVDYLTAVEVSGRDLRTGYSNLVTRLKSAAWELRVPLVLAAQLARPKWDAKRRGYVEEPELHELGETSFIERKAEIVALFWRDSEGVTHGKLAKLKYGRNLPRFYVYHDESNGLLTTEEY